MGMGTGRFVSSCSCLGLFQMQDQFSVYEQPLAASSGWFLFAVGFCTVADVWFKVCLHLLLGGVHNGGGAWGSWPPMAAR